MKLYAPEYYKDFACIADKCRHSCCIGWEIDVDGGTVKMYESLKGEYAAAIRESIEPGEPPHFRLSEGDRCPHLNKDGLCRIILAYGEDALCDICREHPRFYNDTPHGREVGLGMSCEEACRLILSSDGYANIIEIGDTDGECADGFDPLPFRTALYALLADRTVPYPDRLEKIGAAHGVSLSVHTDAEWRETLASLEYLDDAHRAQFQTYSSDPATPEEIEKPLERALAYFICRHCTGADSSEEFRAALGLSLFLERLLASLAKETPERLAEHARIVSEEIEYCEDNTDELKYAFWF